MLFCIMKHCVARLRKEFAKPVNRKLNIQRKRRLAVF
jgi:hypothetical protein